MIFFLDELASNTPALIVYLSAFGVAFVTGIGFHEFSHAWAANELGDDTAARQGRLTLNPIKHLDPMGTALLLLVGFGWGKPTPVNPYRLRNGVQRGNMMVAVAGPLSNFVFAAIAALPFQVGIVDPISSVGSIADASGQELVALFLFFIIYINIVLGVFNLIPIFPLDGFKVVQGVMPAPIAMQFERLSQWGPALLIGLLALGFMTPYNPLGWFIGGIGSIVFELIT